MSADRLARHRYKMLNKLANRRVSKLRLNRAERSFQKAAEKADANKS